MNLMIGDLNSQELLLANFMSDISERCYYAGWMQDLEYVLWDALLNGQRQYGHSTISQKDIETLSSLSKVTNTWIIFDDETEETAIDLDAWKLKFQQDVQRSPQLLNS